MALVVGISVIAASARDWIRDIFDEGFTGDYVVSTETFGFGGLSPQLAADLNDLPEVAVATGVRVGAARVTQVDESDEAYIAVDPPTAGQIFDIGMLQGSVESLDDTGVLLDDDEAGARQISVGDSLEFQFLNGEVRQLTVEGIYTEDDLAGSFVITQSLHEASGSDQFDFSVYLNRAERVSDAVGERRSVTSPAPTRTPMCRAAPSISTTERRNSIRSSTSCTRCSAWPSSSPCSASLTAWRCRFTSGRVSSGCSGQWA